MNEEKSTHTREDIVLSKDYISKEDYERIWLEWWANYDPGMDAYLLSRAFTSSPDSPCEVEA